MNGIIVAHIEVKSDRDYKQPFGYVKTMWCSVKNEHILLGLLEEAYEWACDQRLLRFFVLSNHQEKPFLEKRNYKASNLAWVKDVIKHENASGTDTTLM